MIRRPFGGFLVTLVDRFDVGSGSWSRQTAWSMCWGVMASRLRSCPIPRSTELRSVVMPEVALDRTVVGDVLLGIGARTVTEAVRWAAGGARGSRADPRRQ